MAVKHLTDTDFNAAVEAAPLALVDFWAAWCGPCKLLAPVIEELGRQYEGRALIAKVDIDEAPELARRFLVERIPTLVFLKNGEEFDRVEGVMPPETFTEILDGNLPE